MSDKYVATKLVAADGSGDYTDIQSAINALPASGGVVYVKEGTYTLSSKITIDKKLTLIGSGNGTKIEWSGTGEAILTSGNAKNVHISDISIVLSGTSENCGIKVSSITYYSRFENIYIGGTGYLDGRVGILFYDDAYWNTIIGCVIEEVQTGIKFETGPSHPPNANSLIGCMIRDVYTGIDIESNLSGLSIIGQRIERFYGYGIFNNGKQVQIIGARLQTEEIVYCIYMTAASEDTLICGGFLSTNGPAVIKSVGGSYIELGVGGHPLELYRKDLIAGYNVHLQQPWTFSYIDEHSPGKRLYLRDDAGSGTNVYAKKFQVYSPRFPNTWALPEFLNFINDVISRPSPPEKCPVCGRQGICKEHAEEFDAYAKDISALAIANSHIVLEQAKLIADLQRKVKKLERTN